MNNRLACVAIAYLGLCCSLFGANAIMLEDIGVAPADSEVVLGEWHGGFDACLEKADREHIPMFAIWSNTGCSHCEAVYTAIVEDMFVNWRRGGGNIGKIILLLMKGGSQGNGYETWSEGYDWAWGPGHTLTLYPFTVMYWNKEDGTLIRTHRVGEDMTGWTGGEVGAANLIENLENAFAGWTGASTMRAGGTFAAGNETNARLEIEMGKTAYVDIPLVRTEDVDYTATNFLTVAAANGIALPGFDNKTIVWGEGDADMSVRLPTPSGSKAGDKLTMTLYDGTNGLVATSAIYCVGEVENSPKNPLWIGERTADTLAWGEWTMDINIVTAKVATANGGRAAAKASALVLIGGSLWCPDCARSDNNLFDRPEFKAWAVENRIALGVVDVPKITTTSVSTAPQLLSYETGLSSSNYVKAAYGTVVPDIESLRPHSGAGYLSRHMVDSRTAAEIRQRNFDLVTHTTGNGGWARAVAASDFIHMFYTGIPCLIALRPDGSIAGRLDQFNDKSPDEFNGALINRLNELLATIDDGDEENNADWSTTEASIAVGASRESSLSSVDHDDYYAVNDLSGRILATLAATDPQCPGMGSLRILDSTGKSVVLKPYSLENDETSVAATISGKSYIGVVADTTSASPQYFYGNGDTRFPYKLTLRTVNVLTPSSPDITVDEAMREEGFLMQVVAGAAYRIEGLAELGDELSKILRKSEATGPDGETLYQGLVDADVFLPVLPTAQTLVAKLWQSGEIGFSGALTRTLEEDGSGPVTVRFSVARTGGTSGEAMVNVVLDESSTCLPIRYSFTKTTLSWASGEDGEKTAQFTLFNDSYYDPEQTLVFKLEPAGSGVVTIPVERNTLSFTIVDDDSPHVGQLAITGSVPGFSSKNAVIAKEGSQVELQVSREDGTTGEISARLAMFDVKGVQLAASEPLVWVHRMDGTHSALFTLPAYLETRRAYIKLVPIGGAAVDYERNMVTIEILPASLPAFSEDMVSESIYRYVRYEKTILLTSGEEAGGGSVVLLSSSCDSGPNVNPLEGLSVAKTTGALPPGLSASLVAIGNDAAFEISGVPTRTGTYRATYRLSKSANGNTIRGGTLSVELEVLAIPLDDKEEPSGSVPAVPNPSIARARTFWNLPVIIPSEECDGEATGRLAGLLTLTIPSTGRLSAKYAEPTGATSYSANGWSSYDPATGEVRAVLTAASGYLAGELALDVAIRADGEGVVRLRRLYAWSIDESETLYAEAELADPGWSASDSAAAWGGRYTVQLPQTGTAGCDVIPEGAEIAKGDAVLTLKMVGESSLSRGRMTFAGYLPDGRSISGSSILLRYGRGGVALPILAGNYMSGMAGALQILPNAAELHTDNGGKNNHFVYPVPEAYPYWRKVLRTLSASSSSCSPDEYPVVRMSLDAFGGYYDGSETLLYDCCARNYGDTNLLFSVVQDGAEVGFVPVVVAIGEHSLVITSTGADNPNNVRLSFSAETGMFSGTFQAYVEDAFRVFNFRGVLMPGWGGCEICGPITLPRPVGSGSCWYSSPGGEKLGFAVEINGNEE